MTWVREENPSWLHRFCMNVLRSGEIPRHVAFIMDGNRRFARKNNYERAQGHLLGFDKLSETLEWCLNVGIVEVTVYAFSIENFKRSKDEVDGLMELARQKFAKLLQEKHLIEKHGICFRVLGNISLLPPDIQELVAEGINMTKHHNRAFLNVCFAYTSRDEICHAMKDVSEGVSLGLIRESDISESLLERCLYSGSSRPPDLLIRTSGEVRLSDFLLWQSSYSVLAFVHVLWPEFSRWHFYAGILHYQMHIAAVQKARQENAEQTRRRQDKEDMEYIRREMEKSTVTDKSDSNPVDFHTRLEELRSDRESRVSAFLDYLECRDREFMEKILRTRRSSVSAPRDNSCLSAGDGSTT